MPGAILGAVASTVVGSMLADDNGAEGANDAAADSTRLQAQISKDQWNRYKQIYEALELGMVDEAQRTDSPEAHERAAGEASATVASQFGKARDRLARTPGLDPSSGAFQAGMVGLDLSQAATDATQQNAARQSVKDTAFQRKTTALGLGKGLDSTAASGLATSASNSLSLARAGQAQAEREATGFGRIADRVVSAVSKSNWLGSGSEAGYALGLSRVDPGAVAAANQTADPIGSLATLEGW